MGQWIDVIIENGKAGTAAQGSHDFDTDLPVNGLIGKITLLATPNKAATSVYQITKISVEGNGTDMLKSMAGIQAQKLYSQYDNHTQLTTTSGAAAIMRESDGASGAISSGIATGAHTVTGVYELNFGRFKGDLLCALPAFAYKTLKLKWTESVGTADLTGATSFVVTASVYIPTPGEFSGKTLYILKDTEIKRDTYTATSGTIDVTLPLGNFLRRLMIYAEAGVSDISGYSLRLNNGAEIVRSATWTQSVIQDRIEYSLPANDLVYTVLDMDDADSLEKALNLAAYNDAKLRLDVAGAGTYSVVMCEVVPIQIS